MNAKFKAVQLGKVDRVKGYQEAVAKKWHKEGQLRGRITEYCNVTSEMDLRV